MRVAVVGGGIAGLAAAWFATEAGHDVVLIEASDRLGGKIRTSEFDGLAVEEGPDAFLARVPAATDLVKQLGLGDDLISPATGHAFLWSRGELRALPGGLVLGVPAQFGPLRASHLLSPKGMARAALEPYLPGKPLTGDTSVGSLIRRRFGREVNERLVDPLVGGINAGHTDDLSLDVAAAQLANVARRSRSLARGLRAQQAAPAPPNSSASAPAPAPVFYSVSGGLARVVDALHSQLRARGVDFRLGQAASTVELVGEPGGWRVAAGDTHADADAIVLTPPAPVTADLLDGVAPAIAGELRAIRYASVTLVTLAYDASVIGRTLDGSGFLVPRPEGRLLTAATWFSVKWPELARDDRVLVRASAGRVDDARHLDLDDNTLAARLHDELAQAMHLTGGPAAVRVSRYPGAFPQFRPGHLDRMAALQASLPPGLALAGAAVRGVGIPACITSAQDAVSSFCHPRSVL